MKAAVTASSEMLREQAGYNNRPRYKRSADERRELVLADHDRN
jgi:hypothetical protein